MECARPKSCLFQSQCTPQHSKIEYYIDTDPGLNYGISVTTTGNATIDQTFNVNLNSVSHGYHLLGVRMKDQIGFWSLTKTHLFYKYPSAGQDIVQLEYFIDNDPGIGLATQIPITANDSIDVIASINLTGVQQGHHRLFIRAKSANGYWSYAPKHEFFMVGQNVVKLEYFWNTDPGVNMATNVPITAAPVIDVSFSPITTGLTSGFNVLYVRAKNEGNMWSMPIQKSIFFTINAPQNAAALEYFIDADPGLGMGTSVPVSNDDSLEVTFHVNLQNVSQGLHRLFVRAKDKHGYWGNTAIHSFLRAVDGTPDIVQLEYYIDNDPGRGNAIQVAITPGDSIDVIINPNLSNVSQGIHSIYVRGKAADGKWSFTQRQAFFKRNADPAGLTMTRLEYHFDIDPGYGNGIALPGTPNDTIDTTLPISLSGLSVGNHKLHIRAKDNGNNWSEIWAGTVAVTASDNLFPVISTSPVSLSLNAVNCITPDTSGFYIVNTGSNPLNANLSENLSWLTISPTQVGVPANDSVWISTIATPSSALSATNVGTIAIVNNSQNAPTLNRSVTFTVPQGLYSMTLSADTLDLPAVQVQQTASGSITLTNTSCSALTIDSIVHSNVNFTNDNLVSTTNIAGYTYLGFYNGHSYFKSNATSTWQAAESSVNALMGQMGLPGYMASLNNAGESTWLVSQVSDDGTWIGLRDNDGGGNTYPCESNGSSNAQVYCWKWSDGTTIEQNNFSAWHSGEPNNSGNEDFCNLYGNAHPNTTARGKWNDSNGTASFKHLLEISGGFPPGGTKTLTLNFETPTIGTYTDTMYIYSQAGIDTVVVHAEVVGVPQLALETDTLSVDFAMCAMDTVLTQKIYNNGDGPLYYQVANLNSLPSFISVINETDTVAAGDSTGFMVNLSEVNLPVGSYNYLIRLSTNDTLQVFDTIMVHITIAGQGMISTSVSPMDFDTIPRNATISKSITITNNGCQPLYIANVFTGTSNFIENLSSIYLPPYQSFTTNVTFQPPLTGPFTDTLTIMGNMDTSLVVLQGVAAGALTFELESFASNVTIQTCMGMTMDTITLYNVGDGNGTFNITNAATFPSWLQVSPLSGAIPEGDSVDLVLSYDAMALSNASYTKTIQIATSDPITPLVSLQANMFIAGQPIASTDKDTIDFGFTYLTTIKRDSIIVTNTGCDTFEVKSITLVAPFSATPAVSNILPGGTGKIFVTYDPVALGDNGFIMKINGETDTLDIMVMGKSIQYPQITLLNKDSLVIEMDTALLAATVNSNSVFVWGKHSGYRMGTYSVDGNKIIFVPANDFFAGEEVNFMLRQSIEYATEQFIQPFQGTGFVNVWRATQGNFVIRPTNVQINGVNRFSIGDIDKDGDLDMIMQNYLGNQATKYHIVTKNMGTFSKIGDFSDSYYTHNSNFMELKDINSDGLLDIISNSNGASLSGSKILAYKNIGNNSFSSVVRSDFERNINALDFVDYNFDGIIDVGGALSNDWGFFDYIKFRQGASNLAFTNETSQILYNTNTYINGLSGGFMDVEQDGDMDFVSYHNNSYFYFTKYENGFKPATALFPGSNIQSTHFDFNGDSRKDLLCANNKIFLNAPAGGFNAGSTINPFNYPSITLPGDINGDNYTDLILANYDTGSGFINAFKTALYNGQSGNFAINNKGYQFQNSIFSQLADLDNDGDLDFAYLDAQGKLWIAYNEDSNAEITLSQDTISATYTTCTNINTYATTISNAGDSSLVWQVNLPNTIPAWMDIDTTYGQIPGGGSANFNVHINTTGLLQGAYNYNLIFNSNAINKVHDTLWIAFTIANDSVVLASVDSLDFGLVDINTNKTLPVTITNPGCAPINLTAALSSGSNYSYTGAPVVVPAFGSKVVSVTINTAASGTVYLDTLTLNHNYGSFAIPLQAQGCYVSPTTILYEQVCTADSVGVDSTLLMNISGCDSLVVTYYFLPGLEQQDLKLAMFFNGNGNDLSGNNNHGVVTGATLTADRFGNTNSAYKFFNNGDKIVVPASAAITGNATRSISFWLKHEGPVGGIFNWGNYSTCNEFALGHFANTPNMYRLQFWACDNDIILPNSNVGWHHYLMQYNGATLQLYYDGNLHTTLSKSLNTASTPITFGFRDGTSIKASLDDILIYNKYLSPSEVLNLYNSQNSSFYNISPSFTYSQSCDPSEIGLDTTVLAGANQYGCDSTIIEVTSLTSPVSNEGLVAHYSFDGHASDMSGWGRNGTVSGAVLTTDRHGEPNAAYSFDGVDDYIRKTNISSINFNNGDEMSVSFWINPSRLGGQYQDIVANRNGGADYNWIVYQHADGGEISLHGAQQYKSTFIPQLNSWTHITFTVNSAQTSRLYANGVIVDSILNYNYRNSFPGVLTIGNYPNAEHYKGKLDDILLFDRVLTSSEIQSLYNEQQSYFLNAFTTCDTTALGVDTTTYIGPNGCEVTDINITSLQSPVNNNALVAYYPFDGNAHDGSGYGRHGILNGASLTADRWGQTNSAYGFDGNDFIGHPLSNSLNVGNGDFTISVWVKRTQAALNSNTLQRIVSKQDVTSNYRGFYLRFNTNDVVEFATNYAQWYGNGSITSTIAITDLNWHLITGVLNGSSGKIKLFIDGILQNSATGSNNYNIDTNAEFYFGKVDGLNESFLGVIDDPRIFKRALRDSEVNSLYHQHLTYAQSCDIADIGRDTIVMSSNTACDSIQNIVTSLQSPVNSQDLVAFYSFDGNANDMSGWGNNGTVNGATLATDRDGNANSAYGFDGNDWVELTPSLFGSQNKLTLSVWAKINPYSGSNWPAMIGSKTSNSSLNTSLGIWQNTGKLHIEVNTSSGNFATQGDLSIPFNQWALYNLVYDGSSLSEYINGIKGKTISATGELTSLSNIRIGDDGNNIFFNGQLDDVKVYRRALTDAEIQALYNSSSFLFTNTVTSCDTADIGIDTAYFAGGSTGCDSTVVTITSLQSPVLNSGLAAYYTMDGSPGDFSGYGRNATVTGATPTQDRHGNANSAYAFNGSNQYLSADHDPSLNPASSSYGVSLHFKTNATGQRELFMKTSVGSREFALLTLNNGNINVELGKGATSYYCNTTGLTLNDNVWHHLFFQRAPGSIKDTLRVYVDGVLKKQEIYGAVLSFNPAENMYIGIRKNWNGGGLQFPFMGSIDGVMVWNRTLTPAEIQSLANERKGGPQTLVQRDTTHDYGTVMVGEAPVFTTFITNTTCDTLTINDLYTTNSAFTINTQAGAILPYASKRVDVSFMPSAEVPYAGELKVESNGDTLTYVLTGNGCNLCACPSEDVVLTTQAGLDAFVAYYGGCDSLPVSLTLAGTSSIQNIAGLGFIKHIDGHLTINGHTVLTNLNGFGNLQGLTGSLSITNNALITQVDSLHELTYIGQALTISQNAALTHLNGLNNLDSIGQNILITNNAALSDCDAICPAWNAGISGTLTISNNPSECSTVTQFKMVCDDDCTIGDLVLTSQAEVNTFINTYGGCDTLIGNLTLSGGSNINNIHGLSFIRQITGNLTLTGNANLSNMKGLQGLIKITGSLTVTGHVNLVSLDSLHHLQAVLGSVSIQNNAVLNEVNALGSLDTIGGNLNINNNVTLYDCSGLCPVINNDAIQGNISISNNPNNCSTTEEVVIYCTPPMCPVTGNFILTNQAEVNAFVANFNTCDSLIGNLTIIGGNDIVSINGLNFLRHIGGYLTVKNNYKLTHMQGFGNLQKVTGNFTIEGNPLVSSLGHLDSLQHVGGFLKIQNNNALPNLSGLQFLNHIGNNLIVRNNGALTNCSVICTLLDSGVIQGVIDVASNPSACSNNEQVNAVCTYGSLLSKVMINIPQDSIAEGSVFTFTVSTDYPPADTLTVNLASNNQMDVPVPATTKILPNTTSKQVTITLPNDNVPEKQKSVTLTGGAPYLTAGSDQFVLTDNADMPDINLVISLDTLSEGAGPYATPAIVSRAFTDGTTMNITLTSSHPGLTLMPTGVNLAPNELQKQIFIGVADNVSVDTLRKVTITARYIIPSCICSAPENSVGVAKDNFVVSDDDGPTLSIAINPLSMEEGKTNAGTLTITRNTATNVPLTVNLSHNDPTELSLPATATFPIGALSINVPINTLNDPIEDGNQQVIITVAAPGFVSASTWAIVTDINKPDLVITALESLDSQLTLGEQLPYKVYIHNKGLSASARGISLVGYLSVDGSLSGDDILLRNYFMDVAIPAGDTVVYGGIGNLPVAPGTYYLMFRVNPNQTITELLYLNNTSAPLAINVQANYTATASVNKEVYIIGEPVLISGSSYDLQNQKLPNTAVEIYVLTGNHRREIDVVTNAQGDYLFTLQPLLSELGHFAVGAGYPNLGLTAVQDEYDILGVKLNNGNFITWNMMLGDTLNGSLPITNVSGVALTQVTLSPQSLPNGCLLTFDTIPTLPANGSLLLPYQVVAGALTAGTAYLEIPLNIHANDTVIQQDRAYYFVKAQMGHLKASIVSINTQLGPAANKVIEFEIENIGQGTINEVNISVPTVTWLRLVSLPQITNMVPGEKKTVTLEFLPTAQLPFNTPASGNIAINTTNANGISLPFSVMKVSNQTGTMTIDVIDQFTYFSPGSPHVDSARVRITNYFTGQLYADGITGADGKYIATNLPQGQLRIVVDAIRHKSYDGIINVVPGTNQTEVVFVEYQAISFTWDVTPTQIEDEYEIDLIMKFESNVPIPVVTMAMPDTLPQLTGNQTYAFNITMTNVGLITAKEVKLDLPDDNEYEFITTYQQQDILAQQAIQVPVVMKVKSGGGGLRSGNEVIQEANRRLNIKN
ncbi:MAG: DUF1573 domain-containing protein [Saprospiraceae bacterium]|nr:DUF1573 domain-containing protein [Saprospiraceae bacterium]